MSGAGDDSDYEGELQFSESMSAEQVSVWLKKSGIPTHFSEVFKGIAT